MGLLRRLQAGPGHRSGGEPRDRGVTARRCPGSRRDGRRRRPSPRPPPRPQPAAAQPAAAKPAAAAPAPAKPAAGPGREGSGPGQARAGQADPAGHGRREAATAEAAAGPEFVTLRGPSAAVAKNMNASLELPTATSVRAVPVKLLFDNRIVINNHLKRARGGKVSFTHLIGYAMVQALKAMPSMNYSFAEKDGKPTLVKPEHVNLGLAIDLVKPNGDRQLVVAAHQEGRDAELLRVLAGLRGHRPPRPRRTS